MATSQSQALRFSIAAAALEGILIVPLKIIWIISFCAVRHRNDPARRPFAWMKAAYPLFLLYLTVNIAAYVVYILEIGPLFDGDSSFLTLDQIQTRLFDVSGLIENIAQIVILFCLVELGLSFLYVLNSSSNGHNIVRGLVAGLGVVLFALTLALFGKLEALRTDYYNAVNDPNFYDDDPFFVEPYYLVQIGASFDILLWIASIAVFAFTIYVFTVSHHNLQTRSNAVIYLVIGILYLLRNTWILAYDSKYLLPKNPRFVPIYEEILWVILDPWVTSIVLVLVFVIGCRVRHGLWTSESSVIFGGKQQQQEQSTQQQWQAQQQAMAQGPPSMQYTQPAQYPQIQD